MKKIILLLSFLLAFSISQAQVIVLQQQKFMKPPIAPLYLQGNDTLITFRESWINLKAYTYKKHISDSLLNLKVNKVSGKQLSTKDFTLADSLKLLTLNTSIYRTWAKHDTYDSLLLKPNLLIYRTLGNHDSLSALKERSYNSLTDKPTIPDISGKEDKTNKVVSISGSSTDIQYPSAKLLYDQLSGKVDKITGKGLSTEDYSTTEKSKLSGIQSGAEVNVNADWNSVSGDSQILNKPDLSLKADLVDGKVPNSQIPALAISDTYTVNSDATMIALSLAEKGDIAIRTDQNKSYILSADPYSTLANWKELLTPTSAVTSVNGQTSAVTLTTDNIADYTDKRYVTDAQRTAITHSNRTALDAVNGTNTGDNAVNTLYSGLVSNATHTGDVTGSTALTLATVNSNIGTYNNITINAKGLATAGSNVSYWYASNHPTTVLGYGITDIASSIGLSGYQPLISGMNTNNLPKWNGTAFQNSENYSDGSGIAFNVGNQQAILRRYTVNGSTGVIIQGNANPTINDTYPGASIYVGGGTLTDGYEGAIVFTAYGHSSSTSNYINFNTRSGTNTTANRMSISSEGIITIPSTTPSTSSTTGALVVGGGIGVAKDSWINGSITFGNTAYVGAGSIRQQTNNMIVSAGSSGFYINRSDNSATDFFISNGGFTGIGYTSDPTSSNKLAVNGNGYFGGRVSVHTTNYDGVDLNAPDYPALTLTQTGLNNAGARNWMVVPNYEGWGTLDFRVSNANNTSASLTRLSITSAGNATFSGSVTATGATFTTGAGSGKVWTSDGSGVGSWAALGGAAYKGQIDGSTGSGLADGTGTTGWYYACSTAGTHNYGSGSITLAIGDQLYYNGSIWLKIPGAGSYTLPTADASTLGGVKIGSGVSISSGVISVSTAYAPTAGSSSITTLGTISSGVWNGTAISDSYISSASTWNAKESALTFSTGLSRTGNTITNTITQYTDALARSAVSFTAGSGAYNSTTGVFTIPTNTNQLTNGAGFITGYTETDPNSIHNQTTQQTSANFNIDGYGIINSLLTVGGQVKFNTLAGVSTRYVTVDQYGNLGGGSVAISSITKGSYSPTITNVTNTYGADFDRALFTEIGGLVHVKVSGVLYSTVTGTTIISITLPSGLNFNENDLHVVGKGVVDEDSQINITSGLVRYLSSTEVEFTFLSVVSGAKEYCIDFDYTAN